jgi:GAF domain-containing protein
MFDVPIGLVSLVDRDRQFFKACKGLDVSGTSRDVSFCAHAIAQREDIFVVPDATKDPRFAANSLVTGAPFIRFYAASSIVVGGHKIGTLCIISPKPREFLSDEAAQLTRLGWLVQTELRARVEQKAFKLISSSQNQMLLRAVNQSSEALVVLDQRADIMYTNTAFSVCTGFDSDGVKGKSIDVVSGGPSGGTDSSCHSVANSLDRSVEGY